MHRSRTIRPLIALVATFALGLSSLASAQQAPTDLRIAVINLDQVAVQSPAGAALRERLNAFQQSARQEAEALQQEAITLRQRIADGANTLSPESLQELQKQYEDKTIAIRRTGDDRQREAEKMQQEGLRAIEQALEPVLAAIRDEYGYDLILNHVPGVVVMAGDRVDITNLAIERLRAAAGQ